MKKELQKTLHNVFLFVLLSLATTSYSQIGSLDPTFDPDEGPDFYVNATLPLPNGKIIIGGNFSEYNVVSRRGIAKINPDGSLDPSFNPGAGIPIVTGSTSVGINDIKELPDGKILIGGTFNTFNDISKRNMARLNADGTLDETFTLDAKVLNTIRTISLLSDGKIIITGNNITVDGVRKGIARLNADGTLDETFSSYLVATTNNLDIFCALVQPDGKILIGGSVPTSSSTFLKLTRLNPDGSRDENFTPIIHTSGMPINSQGAVMSLALQPDGKIIVGGGFTQLLGGTNRYNFMRINADGSYDATFTTGSSTGTGLLNRVHSIRFQQDGKILIAGMFATYNGVSRRGIARLNANGTLDTSFNPGTGLVAALAQSIDILDDENILIAGNFTSYNGITRNRIAKISTRTITVNSLSQTGPFCAGATFDVNYTPVGTYNSGNIFTAQLSDASGDFSNATNIGTFASEIAGTINVNIPQSTLAGNSYKIRIISSAPFATGDICTTNIVISETPLPTGEATQDFSTGDTLEDFIIVGENIKWYDALTGGNELQNSELIVSGTIYYVSQTINGCESARLPIIAGENLRKDSFDWSQLKYYPNPVHQIINIEYEQTISSITIYNLLGQQVFNNKPTRSSLKIDLSSLHSGTYIARIISEGNSKIIKISKE